MELKCISPENGTLPGIRVQLSPKRECGSERCLHSLPKSIAFDFLLLYAFLYGVRSTAVVLQMLCDAGSLIGSFGRDIKRELKIMSLEVDGACHAEYSNQHIHATVTQGFGSMSPQKINKSNYYCSSIIS